MVTVTENQAKERLAELLTAAEGGQTVAITRNGKAVVQMAAMPNGDGQVGNGARQFVPPLDSSAEENGKQNLKEWLRDTEEMCQRFRREGCNITREEILEDIRKMRGR